jgi:hypothetical protein
MREQSAPFLAQPLTVLREAQLFDRIDTRVAVGADCKHSTARREARQRKEAVAQVSFGQWAEHQGRPATDDEVELLWLRMSRMHEIPASIELDRAGEAFDRRQAITLAAVDDFLLLLGHVDVDGTARPEQVIRQRDEIGQLLVRILMIVMLSKGVVLE